MYGLAADFERGINLLMVETLQQDVGKVAIVLPHGSFQCGDL